MKYNKYDYPHGLLWFWYFTILLPLVLIIVLYIYRQEILTMELNRVEFDNILFTAILCLIMPILAALFVNSIPALRLKNGGLEIRFFFPKMTKWIFLPWDEIDSIEFYHFSRVQTFLRMKKNFLIYSKKLPLYYFFPALFYGHSFSRGIVVTGKIRGYDELVNVVTQKIEKPGV